jgi:hypothetical protein
LRAQRKTGQITCYKPGQITCSQQTQVWTAVTVYVLVAIIRKRLDLKLSLHSMLQILSVTPFEKESLIHLLTDSARSVNMPPSANQLNLF